MAEIDWQLLEQTAVAAMQSAYAPYSKFPVGGIRTTKDAIKQLVLVNETAGPEWLNPSLFRIGASALLNDLLLQRMKISDGYYASPNYVTID